MVAPANVLAAAGTILIFSSQRALFVPGFFLAAAAGACFVTVTLAYATELFPTELRATLSSSSPATVLVTTSPPSTPGGRSSRTGALRIRG